MPLEINQFLQKNLTGVPGFPPAADLRVLSIGGGSINDAYQLLSTKHNSRWFCKFNAAGQFPDLFEKEAKGLALLRQKGIIRVPSAIACIGADPPPPRTSDSAGGRSGPHGQHRPPTLPTPLQAPSRSVPARAARPPAWRSMIRQLPLRRHRSPRPHRPRRLLWTP